ncbi:MAG TPA: hypothetical protein VK067_07575 [Pseudogracilibacillus sp.]|nr:hypothetical protein [Pseudogracilibacillus sp.]
MKMIDTLQELNGRAKHAERKIAEDKYDVIQIQMEEDEEVTEHHAREETLIIVRNGKVEFDVEGKKVILTNENLLQMDPYEKHSLKAIEKTDLILLKIK